MTYDRGNRFPSGVVFRVEPSSEPVDIFVAVEATAEAADMEEASAGKFLGLGTRSTCGAVKGGAVAGATAVDMLASSSPARRTEGNCEVWTDLLSIRWEFDRSRARKQTKKPPFPFLFFLSSFALLFRKKKKKAG